MKLPFALQILPARQIDRLRWDACVEADATANIYLYSWFLDGLAESWFGVVLHGYQAVMPLPTKTRFGFSMVALPPFIQKLGIAGHYDDAEFRQMVDVAEHFRRLFIYAAPQDRLATHSETRLRTNFTIPLHADYDRIAAKYNPSCRKNIQKATHRGCQLVTEVSVGHVIEKYRQAYGKLAGYSEAHYVRLDAVLKAAAARGHVWAAGVKNESGSLVYAGLLLVDCRRVYYYLGAPNELGRQMRATYFFIDAALRRFSGSPKVFDFEGSDIPSVATFYQSFGSEIEPYYAFYANRYPRFIRPLLDAKLRPKP